MRSPFSSPRWLAAGVVLALLAGASALARSAAGHLAARACEPWRRHGLCLDRLPGRQRQYIVVGLAFYIVGLLGAARGWPNPLRVRYESMTRGSLLLLSTMAVGGLVVC